MTKKTVIALVVNLVLSSIHIAEAQQVKKLSRIGYLFTGFQPPKEFLEAMARLGYIEGTNFAFEYRAAEGREERLPDLAAELVRVKVDAIVAPGGAAALAAKDATKLHGRR